MARGHTRGTLEAYKALGSEQKWLESHGRKKWGYYYDDQSVARQRAFFDHFLKGEDTEVLALMLAVGRCCRPSPGRIGWSPRCFCGLRSGR